jgi:hypothetical protein
MEADLVAIAAVRWKKSPLLGAEKEGDLVVIAVVQK